MKKEKPVCVVCGTKSGVIAHTLPHGSISLCISQMCFQEFCAKTQQSVPILWVGKEDFIEHEILTAKEMEGRDGALIDGANAVADWIFTDAFWDDYSEGLQKGGIEFEKCIIRSTPKDQLPLLIGHLKHGNDSYLAKKIKVE
jgi:hypothetical protein